MLAALRIWLEGHGYAYAPPGTRFGDLQPGQFAFRMNVRGLQPGGQPINIPIDTVLVPLSDQADDRPLLIEAKSAGDFANVNKRRKEEASKLAALERQYGKGVRFILFLRGYFDSTYLGYNAAEGIDWFWEHRLDDLAEFGV